MNMKEIRIIAKSMNMNADNLMNFKCPDEIGLINGCDETDGCRGVPDEICRTCWLNSHGFMTRESFDSDAEYEKYIYAANMHKEIKAEKETKAKEQVNHPDHYSQPGRRECIEEMRIVFGDDAVRQWCVMTAYKYRYRTGNKDGNSSEQDNKKAEWYLDYAEEMD